MHVAAEQRVYESRGITSSTNSNLTKVLAGPGICRAADLQVTVLLLICGRHSGFTADGSPVIYGLSAGLEKVMTFS